MAALMVGMTGCWLGDDGDDDPSPPDAPPDVPGCVPYDVRPNTVVTVTGVVVDFATGAPVAGATVDVNTAWDVEGNFPDGCPPLATLTTDGAGRFGPARVEVGSTIGTPFVLFLVTGATAPTLWDLRTCAASDCGTMDVTIPAPSPSLGTAWRSELSAGGMPDADTIGVTLFQFRELTGDPASDVDPFQGTLIIQYLASGTEVRFVDDDRSTLAPIAQSTTLASGWSAIGVGAPDAVYIGGRRNDEHWPGTGCLVAPGWFFVEDQRPM
jgi:hypothetical protein